jgi:hypothetical protein
MWNVTRTVFFFLCVGAAHLWPVAFGLSQDWPGWRGPTGMGHADEKDLPLTWDARKGTNILWKAALRKDPPDADAGSPGHSCRSFTAGDFT